MLKVKLPCRQFLYLATAAVALAVLSVSMFCQGVGAQTTRTIKIVVPFPPGGGNDIVARVLAEQVGRDQGTTIVVENRPGAGTAIGSEAVARAAPDGNTLMITGPDLIIVPHLRKLSFHPLTSFEPICNLATSPTVLAVNSASTYRTLADLLNAARARPGDLTIASNGPGTATQLAFAMLKRAANIDMTYIPYPGTAPALTALMGQHVTSVFVPYPAMSDARKGERAWQA